MKVTTDHIFRMGQSHEVCEDYAASFDEPACVILGDGCSVCRGKDGKPVEAHTDFGSRLLVTAAREVMKEQPHDLKYLHLLTLQKAAMWAKMLGFRRETLSSTLLTAELLGDNIVATVCGDGLVAGRYLLNPAVWKIVEWEFHPPPPYYLRYELNDMDRDAFLRGDSTDCWAAYCTGDTYDLNYTNGSYSNEDGIKDDTTWIHPDSVPRTQPQCREPFYQRTDFPAGEFDMVAIFSDGVQSFTQKQDGNPTPLLARDVLPELLAFKNTKGEFVKRRAKRALAGFASRGIHHQDDFSMAVISVQEDK